MPIYDLLCGNGHEFEAYCRMDECPTCVCGADTRRVPSLPARFEWGGPKFVKSLDREFSSRSELRKEMKRLGLSEAGDRVGGARAETYSQKLYSGRGLQRRASQRSENA